MPLGQKIKQLRESKGLSVRAAAERLGYSFGMVASVESGKAFPGQELLAKMASLFDVDLVVLLAEEAIDRRRVEVAPGVSDDEIKQAVYRLSFPFPVEAQADDPHAFHCPKCGVDLVCSERS
jgi:transcriptional regulator with XRE-family HTH domain